MTIGERIKQLRKKNDLTQEKLADYLCVSYQAVSKWECGLSSPDLALIVPLAKLLNVTTDELLGAIPENNDMRYGELKADYDKTFKSGDMLTRLNVCETAVKEYPGDMEWLNNYAWTIWCRAIGELKGESYEQERERAIKLFDTVIENTDKDELKVNSITGIVQCLCNKGSKKEAKKYVDLFPEAKIIPSAKDKLLGMCLEGEEQVKHKQHYLGDYLQVLVNALLWDGVAENKYTCITAEKIIEAMIPDENYCCFHYEMAHIQFRKAEIEAKANRTHEALNLLKKAIHHAKQYDLLDSISPGEYAYTAPLFNKVTIDTREWNHTGNATLSDDIKELCNRKIFDTIRNDKEYTKLFAE
ncbi:MAG: helix-turn-helix transcriptional regulator [Ruminococcaceae bacterium]|nr:helix-turn-helix transcriptional regulator [Oscillospiraceae bacterium]